MTLKHDYARAMELARKRVAELSRQVEICENNMRQLKATMEMDRRHLREATDSLNEMEAVYTKWQDMTANERSNRPASAGPVD